MAGKASKRKQVRRTLLETRRTRNHSCIWHSEHLAVSQLAHAEGLSDSVGILAMFAKASCLEGLTFWLTTGNGSVIDTEQYSRGSGKILDITW